MRLHTLLVLSAAGVAQAAPEAWGSPDGKIPGLAGQQKRYLEKPLAWFRSGARIDSAMPIVAAHSAARLFE